MTTEVVVHPLDDCDPGDCYDTMMSERTELIKAGREAQDNLVKTVIQLASALVVVLAGFTTQAKLEISGFKLFLFGLVFVLLAISVIAGLIEHMYSSKAYEAQRRLVEDYFSKRIYSFDEPDENRSVRIAQKVAFGSFVGSLVLMSAFAIVEAGSAKHVGQETNTTSTSTSTSTSAPTSTSTSAPTSTSAKEAAGARTKDGAKGQLLRPLNEVGGATNAASATSEEQKVGQAMI